MITAEFDSSNHDIHISLDVKGAKYLCEVITLLIERNVQDHEHIHHIFEEFRDAKEDYLSLEKIGKSSDVETSTCLTIHFRPQ